VTSRLAGAAVAAVAVAGLAIAVAPAASAATPPLPTTTNKTLASGLVSPLSFDVADNGDVFLSQNFAGLLTKVATSGAKTVLYAAPPGPAPDSGAGKGEAGAVSTRNGTVYFGTTQGPEEGPHAAQFWSIPAAGGTPKKMADLTTFEATNNPDKVNKYGFQGLDPSCASQIDPSIAGPATYTGLVDTHPYASVATSAGVYVADAGGNDIVKVRYDGGVQVAAVLPPTPFMVTAEAAAANGFPACVAGHVYNFEPVPTDVEIGPNNMLYVSTLPGGPEDGSLGARGRLYMVNPSNHKVTLVASGLSSPTGIAVDVNSGATLVAELFGGQMGSGDVALIGPGATSPSASLPVAQPAAIELKNGSIYVTTQALGDPSAPPAGKLIKISMAGGASTMTSIG
jgi:hypothetical protein